MVASKSTGFRCNTPCQSHTGGPSPSYFEATRYCVWHDSQVLAMMVGQNSQRRFFASMYRAVLQSGKPGVSASRNASPQVVAPFAAGAVHGHVVGRPFAGPAVPGDEQVAVGHSTTPGAWLCFGCRGKTSSAEYGGAAPRRAAHVRVTRAAANSVRCIRGLGEG